MLDISELATKAFFILQPILGSSIVSYFGGNYDKNSRGWYKSIKQSPLTPPPFVFPIVWPILYIMLGLNALLIYNKIKKLNRPSFFDKLFIKDYLPIYEIQLLLNFSWSIFFFSMKKPTVSLVVNILMIVFTVWLIFKSWKIDKTATWMLVPYVIWISFAAYLNFYIVQNNKV